MISRLSPIKETGKPEDLKITYVLNKNALQLCYELHRLHMHTTECILRVRPSRIQLPPASPTAISISLCVCMNVLNSHLFHAGEGRAQASAKVTRTGKLSSSGKPSSGAEQS